MLLGRGNLRSLVVVMVIAVTAQMTLKGLLAPLRIPLLQWSQATPAFNSIPAMIEHCRSQRAGQRIWWPH